MRRMGRVTGIGELADSAGSMHWDSANCWVLRQVDLQVMKSEKYPNRCILWGAGSGTCTKVGQ